MSIIKISTKVNAPIDKVWDSFTNDHHIIKWNYASNDWECPYAKTDFKEGGDFVYRMAAKDESMAFDFGGTFNKIENHKKIKYTLGDGRKVNIDFIKITDDEVEIVEEFEAEKTNPEEMQKTGWQARLDNFKMYTETL